MGLQHPDQLILDGLGAKRVALVSDTIAKVSGTTAYGAGDLIAQSATAGSVVPFEFEGAARLPGRGGRIKGAKLSKNDDTVTNASFRIHLYRTSPTPANGDNGAFLTSESGYIGSIPVDMTSGAIVFASPEALAEWSAATDLLFQCPAGETSIFGLLEAVGTYTPITLEQFTITLAIEQD